MSDANSKSRRMLTPRQLDHLGLALLELAKEVWVMRDRQMITEALLEESKLLPQLDTYQPGPELAGRLTAERERFLNRLTAVLFDDPDSTNDQGHTGGRS